MPKIAVRDNENLDDALRRFKKSVAKAGTLVAVKRREFYEKPGEKKRREKKEARRNKRRDY